MKHTFWYSQGELRFLMVKRAMDVFYASVGTAMDLTGGVGSSIKKGDHSTTGSDVKQYESAKWQLTLVTAAVASFYSVTGARDKASAVTSSSESASYLIRNAWGMVSLPAVKNLSLQASRLIKGAAVADRIEICGVSCFILSSDPAPELAAAIKRSHRSNYQRRLKPIARLSTIDEQEEHEPNDHMRRCCNASSFVRSSSRRYRQRDVIFHLTGGGFFAHIHSTDLPYLLDWSAATGAVVICPEYALLPEHTFPVALNQVEEVFEALLSDEAVTVLGFETNRIIVTGESAGGNLAASMCVKIISEQMNMILPIDNSNNYQLINTVPMESDIQPVNHDENFDIDNRSYDKKKVVRLPDALMLSCPVLNLSLEMCHSRVIGTNDPVLPSGLISAISDAYIPPMLGISKKDPLASPFYASNEILRHFPSTLLFASSNDPLLDDSVVFNQRLREHGVDSDLIAAHNLPHAYLGLGTAGFPEAKQIQEQCITWLNQQFAKKRS
jgi:acetyl esterase/lipase